MDLAPQVSTKNSRAFSIRLSRNTRRRDACGNGIFQGLESHERRDMRGQGYENADEAAGLAGDPNLSRDASTHHREIIRRTG
jgi:hypothetical protein